jgi:hypothetical protein
VSPPAGAQINGQSQRSAAEPTMTAAGDSAVR